MFRAIRNIEMAMGDGVKTSSKSEFDKRKLQDEVLLRQKILKQKNN